MSILYLFIAFGICIASCILLAVKLGAIGEKNEIAKANIQASKKAKETAKAVKLLSDTELDARMRNRLRKNRK